jgi:hypothetical protein
MFAYVIGVRFRGGAGGCERCYAPFIKLKLSFPTFQNNGLMFDGLLFLLTEANTTSISTLFRATMSQKLPIVVSDQYCRKCEKTAHELLPEKTLMVCPRCKKHCYCSDDCFKADWKMHKLLCEGLKKERKVGKQAMKMHKEWKNDPEKRAMFENLNRMNGKAPDFDPFEDETSLTRMNGFLSALSSLDEPNLLWEKIKDKDPAKQAKKALNYLAANHDRSSVQFTTYADLYEKYGDVWNAMFEDDNLKRKFFEVLAGTIELDTNTLLNLPANSNEDDIAIKPPSSFVIPKIPFGPQSSNGLSAFFPDRMGSYFGSRCWPLQLKLALAIWEAIKRPGFVSQCKPGFEMIHSDMWHRQVFALSRTRDFGHTMFQYSHEKDGKAFHDQSCPALSSLLQLLSIQDGPRAKLEEFKPSVYLIAAFFICFSRHPGNLDLVSSERLVDAFGNGIPMHCFEFLVDVALPFATKMLFGGYPPEANSDLRLFDRHLATHPQLKRML